MSTEANQAIANLKKRVKDIEEYLWGGGDTPVPSEPNPPGAPPSNALPIRLVDLEKNLDDLASRLSAIEHQGAPGVYQHRIEQLEDNVSRLSSEIRQLKKEMNSIAVAVGAET